MKNSYKAQLLKKIFRLQILLLLNFVILLNSCTTGSVNTVDDLAIKSALQLVQPEIDQLILNQKPIVISDRERFPIVADQNSKPFNPQISFQNKISYKKDGTVLVPPGDYIIPVMTYCMYSSGSSPNGYNYILNQYRGERAEIIKSLNSRALGRFSPWDIQVLSWSLQNGLAFEEMNSKSKEIIDFVLPEFKSQISESVLTKIIERWDNIADKSQGIIPSFDRSSDALIRSLGESGDLILKMRTFRNKMKELGNDTSSLRSLIPTEIDHKIPNGKEDSWSLYSDRVLMRFKIDGHYQDVGQIQIRVLPKNNLRSVNSVDDDFVRVDISNLVADPLNPLIQPLSFSLVLGTEGVLLIPLELIGTPEILTALLAAVLADKIVNWDSFFQLREILKNYSDQATRELLERGDRALQKAHDELEKPLREKGIIDSKTKNTSEAEKNRVREYTKSGGNEALKKDFEKIQTEEIRSKDGKIRTKVLPDGSKIVMRPKSQSSPVPTLEVQPSENGSVRQDFRVKVRYP